jgi:hypothetical protein
MVRISCINKNGAARAAPLKLYQCSISEPVWICTVVHVVFDADSLDAISIDPLPKESTAFSALAKRSGLFVEFNAQKNPAPVLLDVAEIVRLDPGLRPTNTLPVDTAGLNLTL